MGSRAWKAADGSLGEETETEVATFKWGRYVELYAGADGQWLCQTVRNLCEAISSNKAEHCDQP